MQLNKDGSLSNGVNDFRYITVLFLWYRALIFTIFTWCTELMSYTSRIHEIPFLSKEVQLKSFEIFLIVVEGVFLFSFVPYTIPKVLHIKMFSSSLRHDLKIFTIHIDELILFLS
jgi:hypothetical protein